MADAGGSALIEIGRSAWDRIRGTVSGRGDEAAEAKAALTSFEAAPGSDAWQTMLATQLQSLAAIDTELRKLLDELAGQIKPIAGGITSTINMSGNAHADQVAGVNQGSMVYHASGAKQE